MELLEILVWVGLGAVLGWLASLFMGTSRKIRGLFSVVIGILGAFLGGWLWKELRLPSVFQELVLNTLLSGFIGSVILISVLQGLGLLGKRKKK